MSDIAGSVKSRDDDSVVIVTPAEPAVEEQQTTEEESKPEADKAEEKEAEKKDDEKKEEEKIIVGAVGESKDLYQKTDQNGDKSWSDKPPSDLEEAAENEETLKYAVIVRKKKPAEADSNKPLVIDSIIVQSPYLKRVLGKVFKEYPGIVTDVSRLTFDAPFECFVHCWDRFEAALEDTENDQITKEHLTLLYTIMKAELGDIIVLRSDYFKNRAVPFQHVWTLFPPGSTVWGSMRGKPVGLRFNYGNYAKTQCGTVYSLSCSIIEWDGAIMGWSDCDQRIPNYLGTMPFSSLPCFPFKFHAQPEMARALLVERGRQWQNLAGYRYKAYKGMATWYIDDKKQRKEFVQSRIVIDGVNWEKNNPDWLVYISSLTPDELTAGQDEDHTQLAVDAMRDDGCDKDGWPPLSEDLLLMTSPLVRGYALKQKKWMEFFIEDVTEVTYNDKAFKSLVLAEDHKELILAFAQSQVKFKDTFDDIISGKGKGIIMLLSGGPGIGKTLTAESVAEEMRVPLYIMSAGDLGADANSVENNLQEILEMIANWNAVLLDECDVFLEERSAHDIERNRIVSIFLRTLEYYEGILFLTTNRVKNMDPAFQSRIHMSLEYPSLDLASREAVWRGFLERATIAGNGENPHDVVDEEIKALARLELNGRQIKNVLKTANLLACSKQQKLCFAHLQTVLRIQGHSL